MVALEGPGQFETVAKVDDNILVADESSEHSEIIPSDEDIIFDEIIFVAKSNQVDVAPAKVTDEPADQNDDGADQPSPKSKQPTSKKRKTIVDYFKIK